MLQYYLNMAKQLKNEHGQGLVEYALILVLVAIAVIVVLGFLGDEINLVFDEVLGVLQDR